MKINKSIEITNRRASYEFILLDRFVAGIQLLGTEIKALREGKGSMSEAYCTFRGDELWVKNMHIGEYSKGTIHNHEPTRIRKLLLRRKEIGRLQAKVKEKGLTIVPVRLFTSERGIVKLEIALAKGKKIHDKRHSIKKKDMDRELKRYEKYN